MSRPTTTKIERSVVEFDGTAFDLLRQVRELNDDARVVEVEQTRTDSRISEEPVKWWRITFERAVS